jgi:hypothetical protein
MASLNSPLIIEPIPGIVPLPYACREMELKSTGTLQDPEIPEDRSIIPKAHADIQRHPAGNGVSKITHQATRRMTKDGI